MFDAILLLAGKGKRTGLTYNKVFYRIEGKLLFCYSLEVFLSCSECRKVILVAAPEELSVVRSNVKNLDQNRLLYALGGDERQDSVASGIEMCSEPIVLIHDGARPFIKKEHIASVYAGAAENSSAVLAVRTIDTIREERNGKTSLLNRDHLWNMQTPQGVSLELYKKALKFARDEKFRTTDDVGLLEKYLGIYPKIIPGSYDNIKVTTLDDLEYAQYLIRRRNHELQNRTLS